MNFKIKVGDYVKVLRNGEFHNIVQVKKKYGSDIETTHGLYNADTLASRINKTCIISGVVTWEDFHG